MGSGPTSVSKMVGVGLGGLTTEPEDMVGALGNSGPYVRMTYHDIPKHPMGLESSNYN